MTNTKAITTAIALLGVLIALPGAAPAKPAAKPVAKPAARRAPKAPAKTAKQVSRGPAIPLHIDQVPNTFKMGPKIISGACPLNEAGYRALRQRGVVTILSVDGERPDVAMAKRLGMRYVHLPIAYSGMTHAQELAIARAVRDLPGPIFVHCHHGQHRGPAAAVIAAIADENWSNAQAVAALKQAGLSPDYTGLWANARNFKRPGKAELDKADHSFPSTTPLKPYAATMVDIDIRFDLINQTRKAGWRAPAMHPDLDPPHEALMLNEEFRELERRPDVKRRPADFRKHMSAATTATAALHAALRAKNKKAADKAYAAVNQTCNNCHAIYRNPGAARRTTAKH